MWSRDAVLQRRPLGGTVVMDYDETQDSSGWYAIQVDRGQYRESADRYDTREELVSEMAFGKHRWTDWE